MEAHICNKEIVLLTYPTQYKCSICGSVDNTNFIKHVGAENYQPSQPTKEELLELGRKGV